MANDVSDDQCPVMHERPIEDDYYGLVSPEEAERERAALAGQGGVNYENGQMGLRGPNRLNVTLLPGIVTDPGLAEPQTRIARGVNLDGDTSGRRHRNYVSEDGAVTGIDNQLYTVMGCIAGWQGHNGFILQFANNQMRDGQMSMLVEIGGIDNELNDREVYVTMLYSLDAMAKSGSGTEILPDFTFHVTDRPEFTHYFSRVRGRIVDGVIITEPIDQLRLNLGVYGNPPDLRWLALACASSSGQTARFEACLAAISTGGKFVDLHHVAGRILPRLPAARFVQFVAAQCGWHEKSDDRRIRRNLHGLRHGGRSRFCRSRAFRHSGREPGRGRKLIGCVGCT